MNNSKVKMCSLTTGSENAHFTWEFRVFNGCRQFSIKKGHFLPMSQKDSNFLFRLMPEQMVMFLGLKNLMVP